MQRTPVVHSPVVLIFRCASNLEVRFADNSDDWRSVDREFPSRANVQRESRACETKNRGSNLAPLFFCRYFSDDDSRPMADHPDPDQS